LPLPKLRENIKITIDITIPIAIAIENYGS